jgi:hypothetical protein
MPYIRQNNPCHYSQARFNRLAGAFSQAKCREVGVGLGASSDKRAGTAGAFSLAGLELAVRVEQASVIAGAR